MWRKKEKERKKCVEIFHFLLLLKAELPVQHKVQKTPQLHGQPHAHLKAVAVGAFSLLDSSLGVLAHHRELWCYLCLVGLTPVPS